MLPWAPWSQRELGLSTAKVKLKSTSQERKDCISLSRVKFPLTFLFLFQKVSYLFSTNTWQLLILVSSQEPQYDSCISNNGLPFTKQVETCPYNNSAPGTPVKKRESPGEKPQQDKAGALCLLPGLQFPVLYWGVLETCYLL